MKTTKRTKPAKTKFTKSALADALGISRQALNVHLKSPDAPPVDDIAAWQILLAERGRIGSAPAELRAAIAAERLKILQETSAKLARENAVAAGELGSVAEFKRQATCAIGEVFSELERHARENPPVFAGRSAVEISERMEADVKTIKNNLRERFAGIA